MALAGEISWCLQCNAGFTLTPSCNGFPGLSWSACSATNFLASPALLHFRGRSYNPFYLVSFMNLNQNYMIYASRFDCKLEMTLIHVNPVFNSMPFLHLRSKKFLRLYLYTWMLSRVESPLRSRACPLFLCKSDIFSVALCFPVQYLVQHYIL